MRINVLLKRFIIFHNCFIILILFIYNPKPIKASTEKIRAISLHNLQIELKRCQSSNSYSDNILKFGYINSVLGYIIDETNKDIIIIGKVDTLLPQLYTEDFVIALRNVWLKYADLKGNTVLYSYPGCSMEPDPQMIKKFSILSQSLGSSSLKQVEKILEEWKKFGKSPLKVNVLGIPFDTRFAKVMVSADYDMKAFVSGSDSLGFLNFKSLTEMTIDTIRNTIIQDKPITIPLSPFARFWFAAGDTNKYIENNGMIIIEQCKLQLISEELYLSSQREFLKSSNIDILSKKFAENFTNHYKEISSVRPIYTELNNLFVFSSLANIIKIKSSHSEADLDLTYFLEEFPIFITDVPRELPGVATIKKFEYRKNDQSGYQIVHFWLPTYGGVDLKFEMNPGLIHRIQDPKGSLLYHKDSIIKSRPSRDAYYWDYTINAEKKDKLTQTIDKIIENLENANIAFNAPESLKVDESWSILLLVSTGQTTDSLRAELTSILNDKTKVGVVIVEEVKVSEEIEASLTGFGFTLKPVTQIRQLVKEKGYTRWEWIIKGEVTGRQVLYLTINAIIDYKGIQKTQTIQTFRKEIFIYIKSSTAFISFLSKNISWIAGICGSIFSLLLGYYLSHLGDRRKKRKEKK